MQNFNTVLIIIYVLININYVFCCSNKIVNSSAERNKEPILGIVQKYFDKTKTGNVLEIASGTGQHVTHIAPHFPNLTFQPSEHDKNMIPQIKLYINDCQTKNIKKPLVIDITKPIDTWGLDVYNYDYIININMIHISPYSCTENLFMKAGKLLNDDGLLITYGPYAENNVLVPESNINFNDFLKRQNPEWGVRDIVDLKQEAAKHNIKLIDKHDMPANNKCLIWKKN